MLKGQHPGGPFDTQKSAPDSFWHSSAFLLKSKSSTCLRLPSCFGEVLERTNPQLERNFPLLGRIFPQLGRHCKKCAKPKLCPAIRVFACVCIYHYSRTYLPRKLEQTFVYQWVLQDGRISLGVLFDGRKGPKQIDPRPKTASLASRRSPYWLPHIQTDVGLSHRVTRPTQQGNQQWLS